MNKICVKCKIEKDIKFFGRREKGRIQSYCKVCLYDNQKRRWNQNKIKAIEYLGGICRDCGKTGHPAIFDFHHRDPNQKEFAWDKMRLKSWDKMIKELDKCDLLHGDCHRLRHIKKELW